MIQSAYAAPASRSATDRGAPFTVRQAQADDTWLLGDLFYHLSAQTRYLRYFQPVPLSLGYAWAEGRRMARRPVSQGVTLIATIQPGDIAEAIGVAELVCDPRTSTRGELAVVVRDDQQGRGIGAALMRRLVVEARARGIEELHADLLPENRPALRLLRRIHTRANTSFEDGVVHVTLHLREQDHSNAR